MVGKKLATADVLSRGPLRDRGQPEQEEEVNLYVNMIKTPSYRKEATRNKGTSRM